MILRRRLATPRALASFFLILAAALALSGCGGSDGGTNPIAPSNTPIIRSISPNSGSSFGGTELTISGEKFVPGSTVTFGGTPGANVAIENGTTIRVTTPSHASGTVDVQISGSTGNATLGQAFTFVAPGGTNTPPVVRSVSAKGRKPNEPAAFSDLGETIDVTAIVEDLETALDKLTYQWSATAGTISGTGPVVTWVAPAAATTPVDVTITLNVVEIYKAPDTSGLPVDKENRASATATVSLHNSAKEFGDMARDFLVLFSTSSVPVDTVMRDFAPDCTSERSDVVDNRDKRTIVSSTVGTSAVTINFGGACPFRNVPGDACAQVPVKWSSLVVKPPPAEYVGWYEDTQGTDQVTGVFRNKRWYLCASDYSAPTPATYHK